MVTRSRWGFLLAVLAVLAPACSEDSDPSGGVGGSGVGGSGAASGHGGAGKGGSGGSAGRAASAGSAGQAVGGAAGTTSNAGGSSGSTLVGGDSGSGNPVGGRSGTGGSSDAGGEAGQGTSGTPAEVCAAYAKASCERFAACEVVAFRRAYSSVDRCRERTAESCVDELSAAGTGLTTESMAQCADALATAGCTAGVTRPIPECTHEGSKGTGDSCRYDTQCASGFCNRPLRTWCGVCAPQVGVGETCDPNRPNGCEEGLACGPELMCVTPSGQDGSCNSNSDCQPTLHCMLAIACDVPPKLGEHCTGPTACSDEDALYCDADDVCSMVTFVEPGETCDSELGLSCAASAVCTGEDGAPHASGKCQAPAADGDPCMIETGLSCETPSLCSDGICAAPGLAEACED